MSGQLVTHARAAGQVVHAMSKAGLTVRYAEAVVTVPASAGVRMDASAVDAERESVVAMLEEEAERAKAILLVNPREIPPRVSVLMLADATGASSTATPTVEIDAPDGFTLVQEAAVTPVVDMPTRTLTPSHVSHRVDVLLAATAAPSQE